MIAQVTAAALVSENKQMAMPASVDSIPTSANQEDHVSMAAHGARRLIQMADNAAHVIGIEWLAAAQGCDFHAPLTSSRDLEQARALLRKHVPQARSRPQDGARYRDRDRDGDNRCIDRNGDRGHTALRSKAEGSPCQNASTTTASSARPAAP